MKTNVIKYSNLYDHILADVKIGDTIKIEDCLVDSTSPILIPDVNVLLQTLIQLQIDKILQVDPVSLLLEKVFSGKEPWIADVKRAIKEAKATGCTNNTMLAEVALANVPEGNAFISREFWRLLKICDIYISETTLNKLLAKLSRCAIYEMTGKIFTKPGQPKCYLKCKTGKDIRAHQRDMSILAEFRKFLASENIYGTYCKAFEEHSSTCSNLEDLVNKHNPTNFILGELDIDNNDDWDFWYEKEFKWFCWLISLKEPKTAESYLHLWSELDKPGLSTTRTWLVQSTEAILKDHILDELDWNTHKD